MMQDARTSLTSSAWLMLLIGHFELIVIGVVLSLISDWQILDAALGLLCMGQLPLLAIWLTFGLGRLAFRTLGYYGLGTTSVLIGSNVVGHFSAANVLYAGMVGVIACTATALAVSLPLYLYWTKGWLLEYRLSQGSAGTPWRTSIASMLMATFVVAVLLVVRRYLNSVGTFGPSGDIGFSNGQAGIAVSLIYAVMVAELGAVVVFSVWACLSVRGCRSWMMATSMMVGLMVSLPMHAKLGSESHGTWAWIIAGATLTIILSLLFLRSRGVRIILEAGAT